MNAVNPLQCARRSMLYRWHERHDASFIEHAGAIVVANYAGGLAEPSAARELGLCDLSTFPRWGVTGRGAPASLTDVGFDVPPVVNRSARQVNGDILARLSDHEYLLLSTGQLIAAEPPAGFPYLRDHAAGPVYELPRQDSHAWFALTGRKASTILAGICGVDMRDVAFADGDVAQTSIARVSAVVLRSDLGDSPCFFILVSSTAAEYLWDAIAGTMDMPDAAVIGMHALGSLVEQEA
jgi:sarcosine oxidase subunit gamma